MLIFKAFGTVQFRSLSSVGWIDPDQCAWYFELETMGL